ncbi:type II toxin-antitoxin system HigA family antitoxin [Phormidesmis sp. 146-35]
MTLTFNPTRYSELLSQYQPRLIKTEESNEQALAIVEELMHRSDRSSEEDELLELLVALIEKFEQAHYLPGSASTSQSMLLFLMEQRELTETDLIEVFGSEQVVVDVLVNRCEMSRTQIKALGKFFGVEPSLFI